MAAPMLGTVAAPPTSVQKNPNVTLHFVIENILMKDLTTGHDALSINGRNYTSAAHDDMGNTAYNIMSRNYTPPGSYQSIWFNRLVLLEDIKKQKFELMPGFKLTWYYIGTRKIEPDPIFSKEPITDAFVR